MPTTVAVPLDATLLPYWQAQLTARRRARASLPATWLQDPRPEMAVVVEGFVESMVAIREGGRPRPDAARHERNAPEA